jgi:hypothetical protein
VEGYKEKIEEEASSKKWLPWLLLLLGLIALFFIWRSCSKPDVPVTMIDTVKKKVEIPDR